MFQATSNCDGRQNVAVPDEAEVRVDPLRPDQAPGFLLMALGTAMRERVEVELAPLGIALRHYSALGHLSAAPGTSYSELARRAGITVQSMQATLLQLEALHAVERRSDPGRGRTAELHVTERGRALVADARTAFRRAEADLLGTLRAEERGQLTATLLSLLPPRPSASR